MVDTPVSASDTHSGVAGPSASPQGLTRSGSVRGATPGWSATRLVTWKATGPWSWATPVAPAGRAATTRTSTAAVAAPAVNRRTPRRGISGACMGFLLGGCGQRGASGDRPGGARPSDAGDTGSGG